MSETKDDAEARKARAEADKAEAEAREFTAASARALREAERRQQLLAAERETVAAQAGRWSSLVPDLSGVERGTTTVSGSTAMYEADLLARAMQAACQEVVDQVVAHVARRTVLVTTDADLVASDAVHRQVDTAISELEAAAALLVGPSTDDVGLLPALGVVAAAVPTVLSLLATSHTVTASASTPSTAVACTLTAGRLSAHASGITALHDTFRVLERGPLDDRMDSLLATRGVVQELAETPPPSSGDPDPRVAAAAALLTRIDAFVSTVTAVTGSSRSLLTVARSRQRLHGTTPIHVLLVHDPSATATQVVDSKTGDDPFRVAATVTVPWLLIRSDEESVVAAGIGSGTATARGTVGDEDVQFS